MQAGWGFNAEDYSGRADKIDNGKVSSSLAWPGDEAEVTRGLDLVHFSVVIFIYSFWRLPSGFNQTGQIQGPNPDNRYSW